MTEFGATATERPKSLSAVVQAIQPKEKSTVDIKNKNKNKTGLYHEGRLAQVMATMKEKDKNKTGVSQPRRVVKYDSDDDSDPSETSVPPATRITQDEARVEDLRLLVKLCKLNTDEDEFKLPTGNKKIKTEVDNGDSDLIDLGNTNEPITANDISKPTDGTKDVTEAHDDKNQAKDQANDDDEPTEIISANSAPSSKSAHTDFLTKWFDQFQDQFVPGVGFQHGPEFLEQVKTLYDYVTTEVFPDSHRRGHEALANGEKIYINDGAPVRGFGGGGKAYTNDITPTFSRADRVRLRAAFRGYRASDNPDADLWYKVIKSRMYAWQEQKQIMREMAARQRSRMDQIGTGESPLN